MFIGLNTKISVQNTSNFCVEDYLTNIYPPNTFSSKASRSDFDNFDNVVLNVNTIVFLEDNDITDLNDPNYVGATEHDALEAVAVLNRTYNEFKIFFKYNGISVINDSFLALQINPRNPDPTCIASNFPNHTDYAQVIGYINQNSNNPNIVKPNSINVYVMKESVCFGGVSFHPTRLQVSDTGFTGATLVHEIGNNLGLIHTRGPIDGNFQNNCEHVTRDPADPNFNAVTAGDKVVDTPAMPQFSKSDPLYSYNEQTCTYTGTSGDCQGTPYELQPEDLMNSMSNAYSCVTTLLTVGQGIRMQEKIAAGGLITFAVTSVASLYEPYKGEYYSGSGQVPAQMPLFQPGFDYRFVECYCECPSPSPHGQSNFTYDNYSEIASYSSFETNFNSIVHQNGTAIIINQLQLNGTIISRPIPERCYNISGKGIPNSGRVVRFNDNEFNNNITTTEKNSNEINDPYLINDLEPGLYKIEKDYELAPTDQRIILKEEN